MTDMTPDVAALADKLKASVTDPAKQEMIAAIAADASRVAVLALTDPQAAAAEVAIVKATLANVSQAEAANAVQAVTDWVTDTVGRVMSKALPVYLFLRRKNPSLALTRRATTPSRACVRIFTRG